MSVGEYIVHDDTTPTEIAKEYKLKHTSLKVIKNGDTVACYLARQTLRVLTATVFEHTSNLEIKNKIGYLLRRDAD